MPAAALPPDEAARLGVLRAHRVLDTPAEADFDALTRQAMAVCGTPIGTVSLVDGRRQWFKSSFGLSKRETPRDQSVCAHALLTPDQALIVPDLTLDPRFADNPLVVGDPKMRFYAGIPLHSSEGHVLGTLCVIDHVPRELSPMQIDELHAIAGQVSVLLSLRRRAPAEHRLALGFGVGLALLLAMACLFALQVSRFLSSDQWVSHTNNVIRYIERTLFEVQAAESSQRGFTSSGQETYLPPYRAALALIPANLAAVRAATADNPVQQQHCAELQAAIDAKLAVMEKRFAERRSLGLAALDPKYLDGSGRRSMSTIIHVGQEMITLENDSLRQRDAARAAGFRRAVDFLIGASVVGTGLLVAGFLLTRRELRRTHALGGSLTRANLGLANEVAERRRAEDGLRASQARFTAFMENAPAVAFIKDEDGHFLYGNRTLLKRFGLTAEQWLGKTDFDFWPEAAPALRAHDKAVLMGEGAVALKETLAAPDGGTSHWLSYKFPLRDELTGHKLLAGMAIDITARETAEAALRTSLREKETLLQEVHHRVKNNLQIIGSLLSMQARRTRAPAALAALRESAGRVKSIALVHEKLYGSPDLESIDAADYLRTLSRNLMDGLGAERLRHAGRVALNFDLEDGHGLDASVAIACGLIVNEALTNSLKHGFPDARSGEVVVALTHPADASDHWLRLEVRDNGVGVPPEALTPAGRAELSRGSMGMRLVRDLSKQIGGRFELDPTDAATGAGLTVRVAFPARAAVLSA